MEQKVLNYTSTSSRNIIEADGFKIKGGEIIGQSDDQREVKIISYASTMTGTKNIVEADGFSIKGEGMIGGASASPSIDKIPYIAQLKSNDQMTDGQKLTITNYNLMRTTLIKNGFMEDK